MEFNYHHSRFGSMAVRYTAYGYPVEPSKTGLRIPKKVSIKLIKLEDGTIFNGKYVNKELRGELERAAREIMEK